MDYGHHQQNRTRTGPTTNYQRPLSPSHTQGTGGVNISVGLTFSPVPANQTEDHVIIHRSEHCIVLNNYKEELKRKLQREQVRVSHQFNMQDIMTKGWFSKEQIPYQQLGKFSNIYDGVEKVKENLPHTRKNYDDLLAKNLKFIKKVQAHHNIHLQEPGRTVKTLRQYHGQIIDTWLPIKSQKEEMIKNHNRFATEANPVLQIQVGPHKEELHFGRRKTHEKYQNSGVEDEAEKMKMHQIMRSQNSYLHTPSLKKLALNSVDGRSILKSEIASSNNRLLQIKHGIPMKQIIQEGQSKQYLGNQSLMDLSLMEQSAVQLDYLYPSTTDIQNEKSSMLRKSVDSVSVMKKPSVNKLRLQSINGRYSVHGSLTQPISPSKQSLQQSNPILPSTNNTSAMLNPDGVILIPNFHQSKKPKVIKMADLVNIVNQGSSSASNPGSNLNSFRDDGLRSKRGGSNNDYHDGINRINAQSALGMPNHQHPSSINVWQTGRKTALTGGFVRDPNQINYHKKLKDEFDGYDNYLRQRAQAEGTSPQKSPISQKNHIRQMIANSFLNLPFATSYQKFPIKKQSAQEIVSELNSTKGDSEQFEFKIRNSQIGLAPPRHKMTYAKKLSSRRLNPGSQSVSWSSNNNNLNGGELSFIDRKAPHHLEPQTSIRLSQSGVTGQVQQAKRSRLTRIQRDQYLITAIINSIKDPSEQTKLEEAELIKKISDDFLWKECSTLLKDYYKLDTLQVIRDNKQIMFGLYKLYLLHSLLLRIKQIEDNPNHPALKKLIKRGQLPNITPLAQPDPNGEPLIYEEYSDDEHDGFHSDGGEDDENRKYRGYDKDDIYKHKMEGFIRLLQDILNPAEVPEARELDSVFQLKSSVHQYYQRKGELSDSLTETLYAMMQERSAILEAKQKYLFKPLAQPSTSDIDGDQPSTSNVQKIHNLYIELEQMRLQSGRDRIKTYREMLENLLNQAKNSNQSTSPQRRH